EHELDDKVTIAGNIEAIGGKGVEAKLPADAFAIDRQRRPGQRRGAEWQHVQPTAAIWQTISVAAVFLDAGEEVVRREHRLRALQVRVARKHEIAIALGSGKQGALQLEQASVDAVERIAHPQLQVGDDLIIAAAPGMEFAADVAEARDQGALDMR